MSTSLDHRSKYHAVRGMTQFFELGGHVADIDRAREGLS